MEATHSLNTCNNTAAPIPCRTSQLCKPLIAILKDSEAGSTLSMLEYFVQYMEEQDALHLLHFWFAVESFKTVAPSPKHTATDSNGRQLSTSAGAQTGGHKQCDTAASSVETSRSGHMTRQTVPVPIEKDRSSPAEYKALNPTRVTLNDTVTNTVLNEGTGQCIDNNIEGRKNVTLCSTTSDTLQGQREAAAAISCNCDEATPQSPTQGIRVHPQRLLKQLSLNCSMDALSIYTTYIALNALCPVSMPDDIRQLIEVNICPEDGRVNRNCFDRAQAFVYQSLEERFYPGFLSSHHLCKYQFEYISSGKVCLLDFLLGENALFYFMEFMEQEGSTPLVQFWLTADSFRSQLSDPLHVPDLDRDTTDAIAIYERYFSLQASSPLHFDDTTRMDIENKICDEDGPRADSYDTAQKQAYDRMNEFYFPGFLKSSVYLRFLNELVVTLNRPANQISTAPATRSATSEKSSLTVSNQIDFAQNLDDPDSLWRRTPTVLRLGYVDEFGQYVSEIEPIPSKSLKQKGDSSKKFSWLRKTREEEELAMKIARTIVNEVLGGYRTNKSPS